MDKPSKAEIKRVIGALKRSKRKALSLEQLSRLVGLYPDVLGQKLSYFNPMILLDPSINVKTLLPELEEYVKPSPSPEKKPGQPSEKKIVITKKELSEYPTIASFVYKKMTNVGGLVDTSYVLSDHDLALLGKLIANEQKARKRKNVKKK